MSTRWYDKTKGTDNVLSYQSGFSFGRLFHNGYPGLSEEELYQRMHDFHVSPLLNRSVYMQGFILGYLAIRQRIGKFQPIHPSIEKFEEFENMKVSEHKEKIGDTPKSNIPVIKSKDLAKNGGIPFCILDIKQFETKRFGLAWGVKIDLGQDFGKGLGANEDNEGVIIISVRHDARDALLESFQGDLPIHNVILTETETKSGNSYFSFADGPEGLLCPCGEQEAAQEDILLDDHPF